MGLAKLEELVEELETRLDTHLFFTVSPSNHFEMAPGEILTFGDVVSTSDVSVTDDLASSGNFTCTHPGWYLFSLTVKQNGGANNDARLAIYHNSNLLTNGLGQVRWDQGATSSVVQLEAGDHVSVRCLDIGGHQCSVDGDLRYT